MYRWPQKINLKEPNGTKKKKRDVCKEIRELDGLGPLLAKNYWQFWQAAASQRPLPDNAESVALN